VDKNKRLESSIPVQSRISIVDLARLAKLMTERGLQINTMSQLVSWSIGLLCDLFEGSPGHTVEGIETVADAHRYLTAMGLYQRGVRKRCNSRIAAAMQLDTLRLEGLDPSYHAPMQYKVIHSPHAHQAYDGEFTKHVRGEPIDFSDPNEVKEKMKELEELKKQTVQSARDSGLIVEEREEIEKKKFVAPRALTSAELDEKEAEILERDRERMKLENAPIDMDALCDSLVDEPT